MSDNKVMVVIGANDSDFQAKMGRVEKGFENVKDSVFSLQGALAGLGITAAVSQSVQAMNQAQKAAASLSLAARYTGEDIQAVNAAAKDLAEDGLMSVAEASQALQLLLSRGYGLEQSVQLMERLKDAAAFNRQSHLEFGEAVVSAAEGLKNENSVLVDNAGVTKNVSVMWKEYAAQLGKSVEELTQAEKRQAEFNGIMRETEGQIGNAARMTDTFAGAQARLNQELFNTNEAMGRALVPVLSEIAKGLLPVVQGIRDFVGGFQMASVTIAAFVDKWGALHDAGGLIGISISGDRRNQMLQKWRQIDQAVEEQRKEIFKKLEFGDLPEIGNDTGARRQDTNLPDKKSKRGRKPKIPDAYDMDAHIQAYYEAREELKQIQAEMYVDAQAQNEAYLNYLGQMSPAQQKAFDESAMQNKWAVNSKEADRRVVAEGERFAAMGDPREQQMLRIKQEEDAWIQSWAMLSDTEEEYEQRKLQIQRYYDQQRLIATVEGAENRLRFEQASAQKQVTMVASAGVQMTNSVANSNKAMFMANKAFRLIEAGMELKAGVIKTWNSYPYPWNIPMTALHVATGVMQLSDLASAGFGGSTGSPGGNYGGGTPTSPIVTQPVLAQQQQPLNVTFNVNGTILSDQTALQRWFEETAAPTIRDLAVNRNVSFGFQTA